MSEETVPSGGSALGSPKDKIKFLCSHGGKILPRPSDGLLKYIGGETRVISVPRDIKFQELMKKLTYQLEGDLVLKYQLIPEDLDALVSVKTDEDLRYMVDECDRSAAAGSPRLRAFLFPAKPVLLDSLGLSGEAIEQHYIDAINGIIRASGNAGGTTMKPPVRPSLGQNHPIFSVSSTCSSPRSPDEDAVSTHDHVMPNGGFLNDRSRMHKVQSMPSFGSLNSQQQNSHYTPAMNDFPQSHYPNYRHQTQQRHGYQSNRSTMDPFRGLNRPASVRSSGGGGPYHNYYYLRQSRGTMMAQVDDYGHCYERRHEKGVRSASLSPVPLSPRYGHSGFRPWDGLATATETYY